MNTREFDELAGRIDATSRAVLQLTAALEMADIIDGPRVARMWRGAVAQSAQANLRTSRRVLQELADRLDDARSVRQSRAH